MGWLRLGAHSESLGHGKIDYENKAHEQFVHY